MRGIRGMRGKLQIARIARVSRNREIPAGVLNSPPPFYVVLVSKGICVLGFPDSVCDLSGGPVANGFLKLRRATGFQKVVAIIQCSTKVLQHLIFVKFLVVYPLQIISKIL